MYLFGSSVSTFTNSRPWLWRQITNHETVLWVNVVVQILVNSGSILQVCLQCRPVARQWDPTVQGTCVSPEILVKLGIFQGGMSATIELSKRHLLNRSQAINTCTALTLSLLPAFKLCHLKISTVYRIGVSILLGIGVL